MFSKKHSVCVECGVHFEPVSKELSAWGHLCAEHRKKPMEDSGRKKRLQVWVDANWERLEHQMNLEIVENAQKEAQKWHDMKETLGDVRPAMMGFARAK